MNWMTVQLRSLSWKMLLVGASAGVWAAFLHESLWRLLSPLLGAGAGALLAGAGLGLGFAMVATPLDDLLHRFHHRAVWDALAGGLAGAVLGGSAGAAKLLLAPGTGPLLALPALPGLGASAVTVAGLAAVAAVVGAASQVRRGRPVTATRRAALAALTGALLGVPLAGALLYSDSSPWVAFAGLAVWGAAVAWAAFWCEKRFARRWLRLLTGPGEDEIFPLQAGLVTLGKNEKNDIPLLHFEEIYPFHCQLRWAADHYEIIDNEQGGIVLVNFRQVEVQSLKPGDLVKIGTALLQYGEAS